MDLKPNKTYKGFYAVFGKAQIFLVTNRKNITMSIAAQILNHLCDIRHITSDCRKSIIDTLKSSVNEYKSIKQEISPATITFVDSPICVQYIQILGKYFQVNTPTDSNNLPWVFEDNE